MRETVLEDKKALFLDQKTTFLGKPLSHFFENFKSLDLRMQ